MIVAPCVMVGNDMALSSRGHPAIQVVIERKKGD